MAKPASLTAGLVAKKGEATPAAAAIATANETKQSRADIAAPGGYHKSLTVKLDKDRYLRLKQAGLASDKSSQEIFVEALDEYLSKHASQ